MPSGEERLISLNANQARFGGDLKPTVRLAKQDFKVRVFLVWHAFLGYWGGVDGNSLPGYGVRDVGRSFSPAILQMNPHLNTNWWGTCVGVVPPDKIGKFYDDYHKRLKEQGVDGVKVDSQSVIEGVAAGLGGRVAITRAYRKALEASVAKYFDGRLINCMANAMETYYCSPRSTDMRTSIDFWPTQARNAWPASLLQRAGRRLVRRVHAAGLGHVPVRPRDGFVPCRGPRGFGRRGLRLGYARRA